MRALTQTNYPTDGFGFNSLGQVVRIHAGESDPVVLRGVRT